MRLGVLYGGFGGFDIGAIKAGVEIAWSIEYDERIAAVARRNLGDHVVTADVAQIDPSTLLGVDYLHASPPCPNFSAAKVGGTEQAGDVAHARAVAGFIQAHRPKIFTLENVVGYRRSESLRIVLAELTEQGYCFDLTNVCASRFGVPQTRNRLLVRAIHGGLLPQLLPSKSRGCWFEAIADLVDGLEDTEFAEWQKPLLPESFAAPSAFVMTGQGANNSIGYRWRQQPAFTVVASQKAAHRAQLPDGAIKKIDSRCLARWQTFPDWYELPPQATLAGRGIGNAVPCEMARRIVSGLLSAVN